ncbi:sugar phosphate isomerase/epimerase family protein [Occallatibacter savannae]|uniref:sugar phosphate isomerase/epimerase family protein n=1 Tax=Occallatibacter savannae TaxID=1002691 RepID=UPI000D6A00A9|nr:sugar phosphate isomerase/epimerase family protein [Occallatibacter savannae]
MINRRRFLASSAGVVGAAGLHGSTLAPSDAISRKPGVKLKLGLNAYSFNGPLQSGTMTLADAVAFCAENGVDALDATGYYFPGYPKVPTDDYIYALKRTAFVNGVGISGTGVRNNFATADKSARERDVQMVKDWIVVASKLGAPVIRVFSGPERPVGHAFDEALDWMVADLKDCAAFGKEHGVVVGLQQHNDFLKTAAETIRVIEAVDSEWFGSILDIGSLRSGEPYAEIEKLLPYAVSWQIKEEVFRNNQPEPVDLARIKSLIDNHGYRGYVPFEALSTGDARPRIKAFLAKIRTAFGLTC